MPLGKPVQGLSGNELLCDLPFELDAVGTLSGHGFHPLKAQLTLSTHEPQLVRPQGRTPRHGFVMSALPLKADIDRHPINVRLVPYADLPCRTRPPERHAHEPSVSSKTLASFKSSVSNPSVNQP